MTDNETESKDPENQNPEYDNPQELTQENESGQDDAVTKDIVAEGAGVTEESGEVSDGPGLGSHVEAPEDDSPEQVDNEQGEPHSEEAVSDEPDAPPAASQEDAPKDATPETPVSEEIKMVIALKDGTGTVGIKKPDTDIFFESFQGLDMDLLIEEVPGVILNARAQWEENPKYPAHERPTTKPPTTRRQNGRQRATNNRNNNTPNNTEPETPLEGRTPAAPEAPRDIQQALL